MDAYLNGNPNLYISLISAFYSIYFYYLRMIYYVLQQHSICNVQHTKSAGAVGWLAACFYVHFMVAGAGRQDMSVNSEGGIWMTYFIPFVILQTWQKYLKIS